MIKTAHIMEPRGSRPGPAFMRVLVGIDEQGTLYRYLHDGSDSRWVRLDRALDDRARKALDEANPFVIDEAMLGSEWRGSAEDLKAFAKDLGERIGRRVTVGVVGVRSDDDEISETDWNASLDATPARCWAQNEQTPLEILDEAFDRR